MSVKSLIINPGSTSTKIAVFDGCDGAIAGVIFGRKRQ